METRLPSRKLSVDSHVGLNLTTGSTLTHLIAASVVCTGLWAIILLTIAA